jgi:geranyl-CoA carboxylase alpha subunit
VEHPVTEMVTGLDLVALQIRVAAGEALPLTQADVCFQGHALEARLYAEDPYAGFLPQSGPVKRWAPPSGPGVRVDAGIAEGGVVTPFYDPMIAKLIVHGRDRAEALRKLRLALSDCVVLGFPTNRGFLASLCDDPVFRAGGVTTSYLDDQDALTAATMPDWMFVTAACLLCFSHERSLAEWLQEGEASWPVSLATGDTSRAMCVVRSAAGALSVIDGAKAHSVSIEAFTERDVSLQIGPHLRRASYVRDGEDLFLQSGTVTLSTRDVARLRKRGAGGGGAGSLRSPMNGRVMEVFVNVGDHIEADAPVAIMEAMKMHMEIRAPRAGKVLSVGVTVGDQISTGHPIAEIALAELAERP